MHDCCLAFRYVQRLVPSSCLFFVVLASPSAEGQVPPLWPTEAIAVSPVEAVIESFWDPRLKATTRWEGKNGRVTDWWDACFFTMSVDPSGSVAHMSRPYRLELGDYQRLRVRLRPGRGVKTAVVAEVDGKEQLVAERVATIDKAIEIAGPIRGERLNRLTVKFKVAPGASIVPPENKRGASKGVHGVQLRWVMLEKDGDAWTPPEKPFEGMIVEQRVGRFEPGLGLLFGADELERLREIVHSPLFMNVWSADLDYAKRQQQIDPSSLIRPYSLYALTRYGRESDLRYETIHDGIILALVGLLTRNEDFLRQAARHAIALSHIDHWSEGFVDRMPGSSWRHAGFAPNVATIKASLLLDWTWHYLTPNGRAFVRQSIAEKGLPYIEPSRNAMANQGVRFNKGMILGKMALADSFDDPDLHAYVRACIDRINRKLAAVVRRDGTFSEAMNYYGKGTMACTPISYHAASRCLGVPVRELVTPRMLPAMRYILEADRRLNAAMSAFCAGLLGDERFTSQCVPTGLLHNFIDKDFPTTKHEGGRVEFVFFGLASLWAPTIQKTQRAPRLPPFAVYKEGGWVFAGSDDPAQPRISFESGLWDGHGHAWFHKNAVTLRGWGERLLMSRMYLSYNDARSRYTMQTKLYNTFAPSGRDQDASGTRGRGAKLLVAEDLGTVAVVESDNATAWRSGVRRAVRRLIFVRPSVMIVHDDAEFTDAEPGVQSWNSFQPWRRLEDRTCESQIGKASIRLTAVLPEKLSLTVGQDSVSREHGPKGSIELPVYRAALMTEGSRSHGVLTVIEAVGPDSAKRPIVRIRKTDGLIEVHSEDRVVHVVAPRDKLTTADSLHGFMTDGRLLFVVRHGNKVTHAGAFGATFLKGPDASITGKGFLHWSE